MMSTDYYSWFFILNILRTAGSYEYTCPQICFCDAADVLTNCRDKQLTTLPEDIYLDVLNLDLSLNFFTEVPVSISRFTRLEWLDLSYNRISAIDKDTFTGFTNLRSLDLSGNRFTSWIDIDSKALLPLTSLRWLYLSHNSLKGFVDITDEYISSPTLQYLFLVNSSITNINSDILEGLGNLTLLDLSHNTIDILNTQLVSNSLLTLNLTSTGLQQIHDSFYTLKSLQLLKVAKNEELKYFFARSSSLRFLDASDCNLDSVPKGDYPALIDASFRGNHLRVLPSDAFESMKNIQNVDLSRNTINKIDPDAFKGAKSLHFLDLSYNTISELDPETFSSNFKLKKLKLSHNYLKEVVNLDIESLLELDLSMCEITRIDRTSLSQLALLEYLNLSANFISSIPDFLDAPELIKLDFSYCRIGYLTNYTFSGMPNLKALNLRGNRLTSDVRKSMFNNLRVLYLGDNSWRCDCTNTDFRELYDWLVTGEVDVDLFDLICQSPEAAQGYRWGSACYEAWNIYHAKGDRAWMYSLVLIFAMILLFCIILSVKRALRLREERDRETRAQNIIEARERLQRMRLQEHETIVEESTNAPDPRELQRPPPYAEAIHMPRLDSSHPSLAGSQFSLTGSRYNLGGSNPDLKTSGQKRRRKRRKKASSSEDLRSSRTNTTEHSTSDTEQTRRIYMESDV